MSKSQKKDLVKIIFAGILFIIGEIVTHIFDFGGGLKGRLIEIAIFIVPYLIVGIEPIEEAFRNITHGEIFDENFLMIVASIGAVGAGECAEAVAVMLFYQVGELFESIAVNRSRQNVSELMDICPEYANIEQNGEIVQADPDDVQVGDIIVIKPGERIPLDCTVTEGSSMIDTSALTGESVPRSAKAGDDIISGCINGDGLLHAKVTKAFEDSTVARILELVENASEKKSHAENFITKFAKYYTPAVVLAALIIGIIPSIITKNPSVWLYRACSFLVVSCPCALVISVPLSFFGGIGAGSSNGVLIKGSNYIEALSKLQTVVFDKTGTLTKGEFRVNRVYAYGVGEDEVLETAALAEIYSTHPIAESIREAYAKPTDSQRVADAEEIPGSGLSAVIDGRKIFAGNEKILEANGIAVPQIAETGTLVYICTAEKLLGCLVINDAVKPNAQKTISALRSLGISKTVMLTGDKKAVADAAAKEIGIDEVHSELLPAQKVERVEELLGKKDEKSTLAFVGDGINDAPVLMRSDIGFAMGSMGSDAAIEAADIVIMDDNIEKIPLALRIAKKTMSIVKQNIVFALGVKFAILILCAAGIGNMWLAVFADVGVAVIAILNAMRCLKIKSK